MYSNKLFNYDILTVSAIIGNDVAKVIAKHTGLEATFYYFCDANFERLSRFDIKKISKSTKEFIDGKIPTRLRDVVQEEAERKGWTYEEEFAIAKYLTLVELWAVNILPLELIIHCGTKHNFIEESIERFMNCPYKRYMRNNYFCMDYDIEEFPRRFRYDGVWLISGMLNSVHFAISYAYQLNAPYLGFMTMGYKFGAAPSPGFTTLHNEFWGLPEKDKKNESKEAEEKKDTVEKKTEPISKEEMLRRKEEIKKEFYKKYPTLKDYAIGCLERYYEDAKKRSKRVEELGVDANGSKRTNSYMYADFADNLPTRRTK